MTDETPKQIKAYLAEIGSRGRKKADAQMSPQQRKAPAKKAAFSTKASKAKRARKQKPR